MVNLPQDLHIVCTSTRHFAYSYSWFMYSVLVLEFVWWSHCIASYFVARGRAESIRGMVICAHLDNASLLSLLIHLGNSPSCSSVGHRILYGSISLEWRLWSWLSDIIFSISDYTPVAFSVVPGSNVTIDSKQRQLTIDEVAINLCPYIQLYPDHVYFLH